MKIKELSELEPYEIIFNKDDNDRQINAYHLTDVTSINASMYYPECLLRTNSEVIRPINETIMSLKNIEQSSFDVGQNNLTNNECDEALFFFVYNTDNYYHFVYDTLPYLISYFYLKNKIPGLKLLMNYPNFSKKQHYKFVVEFLQLLDIKESDIVVLKENTKYKNLYVSTSYTHDNKSQLPPRQEIYKFYEKMIGMAINKTTPKQYPKKIYISRRSWIHNDFTNIGTNYTTRRMMQNEDALVDFLNSKGYNEIFTENLSIIDKICMFNNATDIVSSIGGGICNALFSEKNTNLIAIESPGFLNINSRFLFSLNRVNLNLFNKTEHTDVSYFKPHMRIKYGNMVGEIDSITSEGLILMYTKNILAGWNNEIQYEKLTIPTSEYSKCIKLDDGLNSPWQIDLQEFKACYSQN